MDYFWLFLRSSTLEVPIFWLFYRKRYTLAATFLLVTLTNAFTHSFIFFGFMTGPFTYLTGALLSEVFAIGVEALLHWRFAQIPFRLALKASFTANLLSWQVGPMLSFLISR